MPFFSCFRFCRPLCPFGGILLLLLLLAAPVAAAAPEVLPASAVGVSSAIVYDLDNDAILFEQNADEPIPPASLTKILSMFLALDFIGEGHARPETPVTVSPEAAATGGSRMGLRRHETVRLDTLLLGMAVSSGNDASHAVAEFVGGSVPAFVAMMNVRARELGMRDSVFLNPHGLPAAGQRTTARDMLTLARAYLRSHPDALRMHNTRLLTHGGLTTWNKNPLLGQYPGADGLKTGWIRASGYNLIFTASKGGRRLLAVIMGAPDVTARGAEACRLLDAGFLVCENRAVSVAAALDTLPVDTRRIDARKTAREAGLLKAARAWAGNGKAAGRVRAGKYGRARYARHAAANYGKRTQGRIAPARGASAKSGRGDMRKAKREAEFRKGGHAARGSRSRAGSG